LKSFGPKEGKVFPLERGFPQKGEGPFFWRGDGFIRVQGFYKRGRKSGVFLFFLPKGDTRGRAEGIVEG